MIPDNNNHMGQDIEQLRAMLAEELRDTLERWWETGRSDELVALCPIVGENVIDQMVEAAIQPVLAAADLANYIKEAGLSVDDL